MRILVTGGSGFVGNHLVQYISDKWKEHEIICITRDLSKQQTKNHPKNVQWLERDLNAGQGLYEEAGRPTKMIHLAWDGLPRYNEMFHIEKNLPLQYNFVKTMVTAGVTDVTITGSCLEYGMIDGRLDERMATNPVTPYAIAKDSLRKFLAQLQKSQDFNLKWVRLFYTYGEGQSENSLYTQLKKAIAQGKMCFDMSAGEQLRDFLPIKEVAEIIGNIAMSEEACGIVNCCSGSPISVRTLVEHIIKEEKAEIELNLGYYPYPTYEPMAFWGDDTKLRSIFGEKFHDPL